ncbi:MAG: metal ABC transporter ATP-binding protein [Anaerolineales bacterium]
MNDTNLNEPARLEINHISVGYGGMPVLEDVSFHVQHGDRVAIVGPNGAGKSTLFKALVGLLPLNEGEIFIHSLPLGHHLDCVAYVPQRGEVDWKFPATVADVVMMGRFGKMGWLAAPRRKDWEVVHTSLKHMGIDSLAGKHIGDLSGGQQQRVFLARALAQEPHIFLMDEPFTGVDTITQEATLNLLDHLQKEMVTVLISTHDLNLAASRFDNVLLLNHRIYGFGSAEEVFTTERLSQAFGSHILAMENSSLLVDDCCPPGEELHVHEEDR